MGVSIITDAADLSSTANLRFPDAGEITATIDLVGAAATTGSARAVVEYTVPNNRG